MPAGGRRTPAAERGRSLAWRAPGRTGRSAVAGGARGAVHTRERSLTCNNREVNIITKLGSGCLSATFDCRKISFLPEGKVPPSRLSQERLFEPHCERLLQRMYTNSSRPTHLEQTLDGHRVPFRFPFPRTYSHAHIQVLRRPCISLTGGGCCWYW